MIRNTRIEIDVTAEKPTTLDVGRSGVANDLWLRLRGRRELSLQSASSMLGLHFENMAAAKDGHLTETDKVARKH
jgi:hypothetical protein